MKTKEDFIVEILNRWKKPEPDYGGNVIPAMKLYASLSTPEERRCYQGALEVLLRDEDEDEDEDEQVSVNLHLKLTQYLHLKLIHLS